MAAVAAVINKMKIVLDTVKKEIEVIEDTKLTDLLSFIDRNELNDYKIVSYRDLKIDKEVVYYPYSYPDNTHWQIDNHGSYTKTTPMYYRVDWINETITSTT